MSKHMIIFIDSGDTIIDESTEIRDERDVVISARCIPGAAKALRRLYDEGYTIAMVADGLHDSFENMFKENGLYDIFSARVYSEDVGVSKPDARMFRAAMDALGLRDADIPRIVMVGNNLKRDVRGANALRITSIFQAWTPRYPKVPEEAGDHPDYTIQSPDELPALMDCLECAWVAGKTGRGEKLS